VRDHRAIQVVPDRESRSVLLKGVPVRLGLAKFERERLRGSGDLGLVGLWIEPKVVEEQAVDVEVVLFFVDGVDETESDSVVGIGFERRRLGLAVDERAVDVRRVGVGTPAVVRRVAVVDRTDARVDPRAVRSG
jgi:hypothetical protein